MNKSKPHALIIDDEPEIISFVGEVLRGEGWDVSEAQSAEQAFELLPLHEWAVVFCDMRLGGADGLSVLRRFKTESPATRIVIMTGFGAAAEALEAIASGAYDYLLKPFVIDELFSISRTLFEQLSRPKRRVSTDRTTDNYGPSLGLVGRSESFIQVMKQVGRVAATNLSVLLTGESGTGKEVVAAALHKRSNRADQPFLAVNCGAISSELIESELFGHVKGAFTGAERDRTGIWEEADHGTVFLDEITETMPAFQVKLLRALQQGEIRRVGSNQTQRVDVRVIAASNLDVEAEVEAGRFRKDLFYRLNAVAIHLPPLRDRKEDILLLARSFAEQVLHSGARVRFSPDVVKLLEQYPWPGNVRELENAVSRAAAICDGTIRPKDLPERIMKYTTTPLEEDAAPPVQPDEEWVPLSKIEARYVAKVLAHTTRNKQAAARILEVDRKTLDRMIKRHKISLPNTPSPAAPQPSNL